MVVSAILILLAVQSEEAATPAVRLPPAPVILHAPPAPPPPPPSPYAPMPPRPKGNPGAWVHSSDYPKQLHNGESGTTRFRLHVNDKGLPQACDIVWSSGTPELDAKTCEVMLRRAKFYPARDGNGKPTKGYFSSRLMWASPAAPKDTPVAP